MRNINLTKNITYRADLTVDTSVNEFMEGGAGSINMRR